MRPKPLCPSGPALQLKGMKHKGMMLTLKDGSTTKPSAGKGGGGRGGRGGGRSGSAKAGGGRGGGGRGRSKK